MKKLSLTAQIAIALVLAIIVGILLQDYADFVNEYIKPLGSIFLNMLKFIVIALFFGVAMVHSGEAGEPA